jgi:hypothetical protein
MPCFLSRWYLSCWFPLLLSSQQPTESQALRAMLLKGKKTGTQKL